MANRHLHRIFREILEPLSKPYGPGQEDYEYDKWRQEQVDDEVEAERLANLQGELQWPDSEKRKQNKQP